MGGHDVAALLVAALGVLLFILGYADHLGYTDGIESSECLEDSLLACMDMIRVIIKVVDKKMQC